MAFYDKLEKANLFLEEIIALRDAPLSDRKLRAVLESPFGDGGWYNYLTGIIEKYGAVPKSAMPETDQSSSTGTINEWTTTRLRNDAAEIRRMHKDGKGLKKIRARKAEILADIYQLLALCYGEPPKSFEYRYKPEKSSKAEDDSTSSKETGEATITQTFTPRQFADEYLKGAMPEYVALMNDPSRDFGYPYQGDWSRNIWEMGDFTLINLPIERLKHYAMKALLDSQLVWFACDVGKEHNSPKGILATGMYQADKLLGVDFKMTKGDRLAYGDGQASHAMALMGVDTSATGEPLKWLVENSWGKSGNDGLWYMYDDWFDEYVYVVIVDKRLVDPEELKMLDQKPRISELWDPFSQALKNLQ